MEGIQETKNDQPNESTEFPPRLDTDIVLNSADNVHFAVHKVVLTSASPVFCDMLTIIDEDGTGESSMRYELDISDECESKSSELVSLTEEALHLEALLKVIYPVEKPSFKSPIDLLHVYRAAHKYEMTAALSWLKAQLVIADRGDFLSRRSLLDEDPLYCYAFARQNDLQEIVDIAKVAWLDVSTNARPYLNSNPVTNSMPYGWYRELWEFREERSRWLGRQKWSIDDHFQVDRFEWRHALVSGEDMELLWERATAKPSLRYLRELIAGVDRSKQDEGWAVNIILHGMQRRYEEEFGQ